MAKACLIYCYNETLENGDNGLGGDHFSLKVYGDDLNGYIWNWGIQYAELQNHPDGARRDLVRLLRRFFDFADVQDFGRPSLRWITNNHTLGLAPIIDSAKSTITFMHRYKLNRLLQEE